MNVVDTLVTVLRLDNRQFERAAKDSAETTKKLREDQDRAAKDMDRGATRAAGSYRVLRNEVVGLFLAFTGANSLRQFTSNLLGNDAAVGRLASNIGVATAQLSAWQGALKTVGGTAADADNAFRTIASAFQNYQLLGNSGNDADFQGLGVTQYDLKDPATALMKIAEAGERIDRSQFTTRLQRLGFSDSTITFLAQGRKGVEALVAEQERLGTATDESSRKAQQFEKSLALLKTAITGAARPAVDELADSFNTMAADKEGLNSFFGGIASALHQITLGFRIARAGIADFVLMFRQIKAGDYAGAWETFKHGSVEQVRDTPRVNMVLPSGGAPRGGLFERLIQQESGGRAGISGPMTQYGQAHGMTQMLDSTARSVAARLGVPWRPDLMRSSSAEGAAYQRRLGAAYLQQGLDKYGGDERRALMFYHGGPNERMWGPKTRAYADSIMGARTPGMAARGGAGGGGSSTVSVGQITIYTAATDAKGIAHDMRGALASRNLVVQAGSGVNP